MLQLVLSVRHQSQTIDEGFHLMAGYRYWQCGDFGINSEHPPLVKMVAAAPLWFSRIPAPAGTSAKSQLRRIMGTGSATTTCMAAGWMRMRCFMVRESPLPFSRYCWLRDASCWDMACLDCRLEPLPFSC